MGQPFNDQLMVRDTLVEGLGPWYWTKRDTGAWEGPHNEFPGLRDKILSRCKNRRTIIQSGGCMGLFPRLFAEHFTRVFTFEPDSLNFYFLSMNCQLERIHKFNAALGSNHTLLKLHQNDGSNAGMHKIARDDNPNHLIVAQLRIDDFELNDVDAIQLDVEGFEHDVLIGAQETIHRSRPVVTVETCDENVREFFRRNNYSDAEKHVSDTIFIPN